MVDLGTSHHVTTDIATLAFHEPYTASKNVIIGDGTGLSILTLVLSSLPLYLHYYLPMCYMQGLKYQ